MRNIKPLPISEELLGAYLEGNLPQSEMDRIEMLMQTDESLATFVNEVTEPDSLVESTIYDESPLWRIGFELPEIPNDGMQFEQLPFMDLPDNFSNAPTGNDVLCCENDMANCFDTLEDHANRYLQNEDSFENSDNSDGITMNWGDDINIY